MRSRRASKAGFFADAAYFLLMGLKKSSSVPISSIKMKQADCF